MRNILVTGFPGFITRLLVERLLLEADRFSLLVEERFRSKALGECRYLAALYGLPNERFEVLTGDITRPDLGLDAATRRRLAREIDTVFHLAAVYDLAVPPEVARRVNVDGTAHVNRLVEDLRGLERYNYVSTFAVAGRRSGIIREEELEHEAGFHNHYEATKHEAEVLVRRLQGEGLPVSIYRPAVVVGSSKNGRTAKYDGPYMVLEMMRRLPWPLSHLNLGSPEVPFQMVPVDFVVEAIATLAARSGAAGRTFHLTDPAPRTTADIFELFCRAMFGRGCLTRVPSPATRLVTASGVTELLGVQRQAGPYFFHRYRFDCVNTLDALDGTGVECPRIEEYVDVLVRFFLAHRDPSVA